jgi:hypothetical protein
MVICHAQTLNRLTASEYVSAHERHRGGIVPGYSGTKSPMRNIFSCTCRWSGRMTTASTANGCARIMEGFAQGIHALNRRLRCSIGLRSIRATPLHAHWDFHHDHAV